MNARTVADRAGLLAFLGTIAVLSIAAVLPGSDGEAWLPGGLEAPRPELEAVLLRVPDEDVLEAAAVRPQRLTLAELDIAARRAGWPNVAGWWPEMRRIIAEAECPILSSHCFNPFDPNGGSYGLAQLNGRQHFETCGEDFGQRFDPVVNLRTALCVRAMLGRFGGPGGWSGADHLGIH